MLVAYFFSAPLIDYAKLFEQQYKRCYPNEGNDKKSKYLTI